MELHKAIETVLNESGIEINAKDIADIINEKKLHIPDNQLPVIEGDVILQTELLPRIFFQNVFNRKVAINNLNKTYEEIIEKVSFYFQLKLGDSYEQILATTQWILAIAGLNINHSPINNNTQSISGFLKAIEENIKNNSDFKFHYLLKNIADYDKDFLLKSVQYAEALQLISKKELYFLIKNFIAENIRIIKHLDHNYHILNYALSKIVNPHDKAIIYDYECGAGELSIELYKRNNSIKIYAHTENEIQTELCNINFIVNNVKDFTIYNANGVNQPLLEIDYIDIGFYHPDLTNNINYDIGRTLHEGEVAEETIKKLLLFTEKTNGSVFFLSKNSKINSIHRNISKELIINKQLRAVISLNNIASIVGRGFSILINKHNKNQDFNDAIHFIHENDKLFSEKDRISVLNDLLGLYEGKLNESAFFNNNVLNLSDIAAEDYLISAKKYTSKHYNELKKEKQARNLVKLKEVLKYYDGYTPKKIINKTKIVDVDSLNRNDLYDFYLKQNKLPFINIEQNEKLGENRKRIINSSALLIASEPRLYPTYFVHEGTDISITESITAFKVDTTKINIEYLISQFQSELFLLQKKALGYFPNNLDLLNFYIDLPSLDKQRDLLNQAKQVRANQFQLTNFIQNIKLVSTPEEAKNEIERFAKTIFTDADYINYKNRFEIDQLPFLKELNQADINNFKTEEGELKLLNIILKNNDYEITGILSIDNYEEISFEQYSNINAFANFLLEVSAKFVKENTTKLLEDFSHNTKNMFNNTLFILEELIESRNPSLIKALKSNYVDDEKWIDSYLKQEGKDNKEDYLAYNTLLKAHAIIENQYKFFKKRHDYYIDNIKDVLEEVRLEKFLEDILDDSHISFNKVIITNNTNIAEKLNIKKAPIVLAFKDLIQNAQAYSSNKVANIEVNSFENFIEFEISNKVENIESIDNYNRLGKEYIKKNSRVSTGLFNAFNLINETNYIEKAPYDFYKNEKKFKLVIKLKKLPCKT